MVRFAARHHNYATVAELTLGDLAESRTVVSSTATRGRPRPTGSSDEVVDVLEVHRHGGLGRGLLADPRGREERPATDEGLIWRAHWRRFLLRHAPL